MLLRGTILQLRSFLIGAGVAVVATVVVAVATDMSALGILGLALSVWVAAQVLYVGLIAYLVRREAQDREAGTRTPHRVPRSNASQVGKTRDSDKA
jgi:uncharacterized membrane protein